MIYLSHSICDRHWVKVWAEELEKKLRIDVWNPFYDGGGEDICEIDAGVKEIYDSSLDYEEIVEKDLEAIRKSDALVAIITENVTIGVIFEIAYACFIRIPVYVCVLDKTRRFHPWLRYFTSDVIFDSLDELVDVLARDFLSGEAVRNEER